LLRITPLRQEHPQKRHPNKRNKNPTLKPNGAKLIGYLFKWPDHADKEVRRMHELAPLKEVLRELAEIGEEEHEGPLIDLAVLLSKIVRMYEHKGIHYVLEKYGPELIKKQPPKEDSNSS